VEPIYWWDILSTFLYLYLSK